MLKGIYLGFYIIDIVLSYYTFIHTYIQTLKPVRLCEMQNRAMYIIVVEKEGPEGGRAYVTAFLLFLLQRSLRVFI